MSAHAGFSSWILSPLETKQTAGKWATTPWMPALLVPGAAKCWRLKKPAVFKWKSLQCIPLGFVMLCSTFSSALTEREQASSFHMFFILSEESLLSMYLLLFFLEWNFSWDFFLASPIQVNQGWLEIISMWSTKSLFTPEQEPIKEQAQNQHLTGQVHSNSAQMIINRSLNCPGS